MPYFKVSTTGYEGSYSRLLSASDIRQHQWSPEMGIPPDVAKHLESSLLQVFEHGDIFSWEMSTSTPYMLT